MVILVREVGVTVLRFWVIRHGVIAASRGGKAKTVVQALAIGCYILPLTGWMATARWWVMAAAVVLTVLTGLDYVYRALTLRQTSARAMRAAAARRAAGPERGQRHAHRHRRLKPSSPSQLRRDPAPGPLRGRPRSAPRSAPPRSRGAGCCGRRRTGAGRRSSHRRPGGPR